MKQLDYKKVNAMELYLMLDSGDLNPDPIGQRPPTSSGPKKSIGIIKSLIEEFGVGMITIRDISNDPIAQAIYGCKYLVIDGGHRCRAIMQYFKGKITINGERYLDSDIDLKDYDIILDIRECTAAESCILFRNINTTTPTNFMEMIMSDEESLNCKFIRSQTSYVKEYGNEVHSLFKHHIDGQGNQKIDHWDNNHVNPRRKWDEYVAIACIRAAAKGNVDAGQPAIEELSTAPEVSSRVKKEVDKFLNACAELRKFRQNAMNADVMGAFTLFYFGIMGEFKSGFRINSKRFYQDFMKAHFLLTGKKDKTLEDEIIQTSDGDAFVKEYVRKNIKNFANGAEQDYIYSLYMSQISDLDVIKIDEKRTETKNVKEEMLALQDYKDALTGKELTLGSSALSHSLGHSLGGQTTDENTYIADQDINRLIGLLDKEKAKEFLKLLAETEA